MGINTFNIAFHIGLHKTASTWFQSEYFKKHPEIALLNDYIKPWDDELVRYLLKNNSSSFNIQKYKQMVSDRIEEMKLTQHDGIFLISAERLSGHPYSAGFDRRVIAKNISSAYPSAKLFLFIRNQVDIINSMYKQLVKEGYLGTIEDLLNEESWKGVCFNLEYYDYFNVYKLYNNIFVENNLRFIIFEEFIDNYKTVLKQLCDFLHISNHNLDDIHFGPRNVRKNRNEIRARRQVNRFRQSEYNRYPTINLKNPILNKILVKILKLIPFNNNIELDKNNIENIKEYYKLNNQILFENVNINKKYINKY